MTVDRPHPRSRLPGPDLGYVPTLEEGGEEERHPGDTKGGDRVEELLDPVDTGRIDADGLVGPAGEDLAHQAGEDLAGPGLDEGANTRVVHGFDLLSKSHRVVDLRGEGPPDAGGVVGVGGGREVGPHWQSRGADLDLFERRREPGGCGAHERAVEATRHR